MTGNHEKRFDGMKMAMADESQLLCLNEEHKFEKTIYKRRSSIFRRRSVTYDRQDSGHKVTSNGTGLTSSKDEGNVQADNMPANTETFHLGEYIEKLKREQIDWEQEYRKRRTRRKDLTKQKAIAESQGQFLDIDRLTESEKAFVRMRPNYEDICKNMQKLSNVALKISRLNQIVHNSHQKFTESMESNISRATRDIIQMLKN